MVMMRFSTCLLGWVGSTLRWCVVCNWLLSVCSLIVIAGKVVLRLAWDEIKNFGVTILFGRA